MYLRNCKINYDNISDSKEIDIYRAVEYLQKRAPSDSFIKLDVQKATEHSTSVTGKIRVSSCSGIFSSNAEGINLKSVIRQLTQSTEEKLSIWKMHRCFPQMSI